MDQKKIGAFIAQRRKELNMTQKELAEKMNITDRAVSKWETGAVYARSGIAAASQPYAENRCE